MEERLQKLLVHYKLTSAQLADSIDVQRSSISHILSGRNKPSYDFLLKIIQSFNDLNAEWLITGNGNMLKSDIVSGADHNNIGNKDLFTSIPVKTPVNEVIEDMVKPHSENNEILKNNDLNSEKSEKKQEITNVNKLKSVILIYDDDTFEILKSK
ncbi:MAG: helix-turn-helix transcriptional regulator [Bacteroidales bacterium]|nr:helix-turn-helix transcriptional regulator [Bacteroidales bacterium]MBN2820192.1 helix-turn-helix transcriptional regulator [Bacteroidales bacterium]